MSLKPEMTVLEVIQRYPSAQKFFRRLGAEVGACILCQDLFLSLGELAEKYKISWENLKETLEIYCSVNEEK
ncbi:hypothetical protein [Thermodesulfatator atlanticus]|uniref:hypothetical protein n=1 Tax=Thermodesulfatator atlanticus TaxID=501497 RepID=UPI0003B666F6|nr:hypothetical protein [Thermodesulfatator atlanticus]